MSNAITYQKAGVNITKATQFIDHLIPLTKSTNRPGVLGSIGGFGGFFAPPKGLRNPVLVGATDGVGTKLLLAQYQNKFDTIGIDLVAMCVNDIVTCGAEPLFFLDYYATGKLGIKKSVALVKGIAKGCREARCALIGGETAEMPGLYRKDDFDLAGFSVGIVDKKKVLTGRTVTNKDLLIGIHSSGLHSNGYSLARRVFTVKELKGPWGKMLLKPTHIYVKTVLALVKASTIKAAAHITGGGFYDNIPRVLPKNKNVVIDRAAWKVPSVFSEIKERARISDRELFRTLNCGIGMVVAVSPDNEAKAHRIIKQTGHRSATIGRIVSGSGKVIIAS